MWTCSVTPTIEVITLFKNVLPRRPVLQHMASLSFSQTKAAPTPQDGSPTDKILTVARMNPLIYKMEYAVRGPLVIRALEIEKELKGGASKPFKDVIKANIGDAHAMGAQPITYIRQVVACCVHPPLIESGGFPDDVKAKARRILAGCGGGSTGAYSQSNGVEVIRQDVAEYIKNRDGGIASDPDHIVLSGGASESIRNLMKLFIAPNADSKPVGVMVPIPQYPLYSASVAEFGLYQVGYYLDEANGWALSIDELKRSIGAAKGESHPRILVVINPGNPTGQVLSRENIEAIIRFAHENKLFVFADEVYQDNVYDPTAKFHSFKKVLTEMGEPYSKMELASFHSVSKGYMGECGMRGGYVELLNLDPAIEAMFKKSISAKLCSTVVGQSVMDCVVNFPKPGEASYDLWLSERTDRLTQLAQKAELVSQRLNAIEGYTCNKVQGAMYAFPQVRLPQKAIDKAKSLGQAADFFYAMQLLENSGICIVPGSGFGQMEGTYHFRTTILPQPPMMKDMLDRLEAFHMKFLEEYK